MKKIKTRFFKRGETITWSNQITEKLRDGVSKWYESHGHVRTMGRLIIYKNESKDGYVFNLECKLGIIKEGFSSLKDAKEYAQKLLNLLRLRS